MPDLFRAIAEFGQKGYQPNKKEDKLSIQLRLNGFSFCISSPKHRTIHYFLEVVLTQSSNASQLNWKTIANALEQRIITDNIPEKSFNEVCISLDHPHYTLLPSSFNDQPENQISFNQTIDFDFHTDVSEIDGEDLNILFAIPSEIKNVLEEYFETYKIEHATTSLINKHHQNKTLENEVYTIVSNRDLYIIGFKNNKLVFLNSYKYTSKVDFIYFILLAYNELELSPENDQLFLLGEVSRSSALYDICYQYINKISLKNKLEDINLGSDFDQLPVHQYYLQLMNAL